VRELAGGGGGGAPWPFEETDEVRKAAKREIKGRGKDRERVKLAEVEQPSKGNVGPGVFLHGSSGRKNKNNVGGKTKKLLTGRCGESGGAIETGGNIREIKSKGEGNTRHRVVLHQRFEEADVKEMIKGRIRVKRKRTQQKQGRGK